MDREVKKVDETELIHRAKENFKNAWDSFRDSYEEMINDLYFLNGDQWPQAIKAEREADNRPCLRINKLPQFVDRVHGDMRQARPSIKIRPVDDHSDEDTADVITGVIRNIETQSDSEIVYDSGGEAAVRCGFGAWRINSRYCSHETFDQELRIDRVKNQFSILFDPVAKKWDRSDGRYCFVYEDLPRATYDLKYPKADPCGWQGGNNDLGNWVTERTVRIAEYYEREPKTWKIYLVHVAGEERPRTVRELPEEEHTVLKERDVQSTDIYWYKINATQILEGPIKIPGELIPIIPVYGKELNVEGKTYYNGVVRHAKDSMRLYNYYRSMDAETIALAPRAPWIMSAKMLGPYKNMWKQANKRNFPYLLFEPDPKVPNMRPERNIPQLSSQAVMQNTMIADQELHDTTGLQLASLGKRSNEQSGRAIEARAREGDIGQFTYVDNQVRAIKHTAKVLLGMIPFYYDNARVQRIVGEDGNVKTVQINKRFQNDKGEEQLFDLTIGKYDVTASVGPSYQTQRQESLAAMVEFAGILDGDQRAVIAPHIAETSDWHNSDMIADQLKKTLPPGIIEPKEGEELAPPDPAAMKAQALQEAAAEMEVEAREVELEIKKAELKKEQAEAVKAEAEAAKAEAEAAMAARELRG
jgi:hypothetical protein